MRAELGVAGVPETDLPADLVARLPENRSGAPWECRAQSLVWTGIGGRAARAALPEGIRAQVDPLAVVGGLVRYVDTPVGPYDEVLGIVGVRDGAKVRGSVTFMAVDSEVSLVGGRTNWAMPKTLAEFSGDIGNGETMTATSTVGIPWRVSATPRIIAPPVPFVTKMKAVQQFADGRVGASVLGVRGKMRAALINVEVESDGPLPTWLRKGRHLGAVVESMTFTLGVPELST
ncbi:acetoacetate decarboxylase family protein [Antrihabitans sp. YC2-6]|uniref:acetoacetate decarboxylase family protein n=1 Tax=Antrihabitans sp. YC2-6 TaxID=2799498 RepID=UPI001F299A68|nr:acetoacetate decarboxylase family protein [Antrihabitans sp. YC2-6]